MTWLGYAGIAGSLLGMGLLAKGNEHGWKVRVGAGTFWVAYGVTNQVYPVLAMSLIHLAIDTYAVIRRWKRD